MDNNLKIPECCSEVVSFEAHDAEFVVSFENSPNVETSQVEIVIIIPDNKDKPSSILSLQTVSPLPSPKPRYEEPQSPHPLQSPQTPQAHTTTDLLASSLRKNFIRKVLMILLTQMLISVAVVSITFIPNLGINQFLRTKKYLTLIAMLIILFCFVMILCKKEAVKKVPHNYFVLLIFTGGLSYLLAYLASFTGSFIVLISAGLTLLIVLSTIIVAVCMKPQSSKIRTFLFQAVPLCILLTIIGFTFPQVFMRMLISTLIVGVIAIHLTFSIHGLVNTFEKTYTIDDYIVAALHIYMDVYMVFVKVLAILLTIFRPASFQ